MNATEKVRDFIFKEIAWDRRPEAWDDEQSLLETGILDSLGMLKLIAFMEESLCVQLQDEDFVPENFESISCMQKLINRRQLPN